MLRGLSTESGIASKGDIVVQIPVAASKGECENMSLIMKHKDAQLSLLLDTGSVVNIIAEEALRELEYQVKEQFPIYSPPYRLLGVDGDPLNIKGVVTIPLHLPDTASPIMAQFYIASSFVLASDGLLGFLTMHQYGLNLITSTHSVVWKGKAYPAMKESTPILRASLASRHSPKPAATTKPKQTHISQSSKACTHTPVASGNSHTSPSSSLTTLSEVLANTYEANAVVTDCRQLLPDELTRVTVRLPGVTGGVDAISLPESVCVKGVSIESTLATVSHQVVRCFSVQQY